MQLFLKRAADLALSVPMLLVAAPLMALCALAIRIFMGSPVLFRQVRIGYKERPFTLLKFRTMHEAADSSSALSTDAERLTRLGCWLRRTSLDELPQLWHVITGEMSLVGPRPLLPQYLDRYTPVQRRRHESKPGITGWAQTQGRNSLSWERKFELDVWYVDHQGFWLDVRILLATAATVFRARNTSQAGHATAPEFLGSKAESQE
jgi:sugar transferase EpsL